MRTAPRYSTGAFDICSLDTKSRGCTGSTDSRSAAISGVNTLGLSGRNSYDNWLGMDKHIRLTNKLGIVYWYKDISLVRQEGRFETDSATALDFDDLDLGRLFSSATAAPLEYEDEEEDKVFDADLQPIETPYIENEAEELGQVGDE